MTKTNDDITVKGNKEAVRPPFPNISSFNISAIILSYTVPERKAKPWLERLNKNAGAYYKSHESLLKEFLEIGLEQCLRVYDFGNTNAPYSLKYEKYGSTSIS